MRVRWERGGVARPAAAVAGLSPALPAAEGPGAVRRSCRGGFAGAAASLDRANR